MRAARLPPDVRHRRPDARDRRRLEGYTVVRILALTLLLAAPLAARAQTPVDALSRCLTDNTSGKDRKTLARWMFLAMAAHPEIKQYASAAAAQATEETNEALAAIFTRLLTETCAEEAKAVTREGGPRATSGAFRSLGALAMQEIMADADVKAAMGSFEKHLDRAKIDRVLESK